MKYLLDTHAMIWAAEGDPRLGSSARSHLESCTFGDAVISDITLLETAMLVAKKRLGIRVSLARYLQELQNRFPVLPITAEIAAGTVELDLPHGDPFDRVIAATAGVHALPLVTRDKYLAACPAIETIW